LAYEKRRNIWIDPFRFRVASGSGTAFGFANLLLVDGVLLVQGETGELVLVQSNPTNYVELARAKVLSSKCWSTLAVSEGRIYARSTTEGVCLDVAVPPLKLLVPQRKSGNRLQLLVGTADSSPLDSNRLAKIEVHGTTNLGTALTNWPRLANSLLLTNGLGRLDIDNSAAPQRYFITVEQQ
jgi:hypothetical protein